MLHILLRIVIWLIRLHLCINKLACILLIAFPVFAYSQVSSQEFNKLSYLLKQKIQFLNPDAETIFYISAKNIDSVRILLQNNLSIRVLYEYKPAQIIVIKTTWKILQLFSSNKQIIFIDIYRKPKEELVLNNLDISVNKINLVHSIFPEYNGFETIISLKENLPDTGDIDIKGRYLSTKLSSSIFSKHASEMATIIAGAGNSYFEGQGVAWGSTISSANFEILLPETDNAYQQYNISVQNHSYGTGIENYYGVDAAAYDASVITRPSLLHIFSAGNSGNDADTSGIYKGLTGYANITGSFKMAKNIVTVGNVDSAYEVMQRSSKGPAYDGRIKPELVAFAEDGSSGAAAIVSGISSLLQQAYKSLKGNLPEAALVKAIMINSADDVGASGIDFSSGYGNVNAFKAMKTIVNNRYLADSVSNGQIASHNLIVPPGLKQLKITLAWTDPPAISNAGKALVNDLDLSLSLPALNQIWLPWVLNSAASIDLLKQQPLRKRDSLNNAEQITIDNPLPGEYVLNIHGFDSNNFFAQSYSIAYQFDSLNKFQWNYPVGKNTVLKKRTNIIRWDCTYADSTGQLAYSTDKGSSWQTIDDSISISRGYYKWDAPDTSVEAILRITLSNFFFISDTFTVSSPLDVQVGFNCQDSFLLVWNKISGIDSFRVFGLGEKYMEALKDVRDSFLVLKKSTNQSLHYTVSPLLNKREGIKSYSFDYTTKGSGCFVKTFLATLSDNIGILHLELGTLYNIKLITWQKFYSSGYKNLQNILPIQTNKYFYIDNSLSNGINQYRVKIEFNNGEVIYSDIAFLFYLGSQKYSLFPNPVAKNQPLVLVSNETDISDLQVFNIIGMKMMEQKINSRFNIVVIDRLAAGMYFFKLLKEGKQKKVFKVIVY